MRYRVVKTLERKSTQHPDYPLLPGDIVTRESDGRWMKHAPGLGIGGFLLTEEDVATLEEAPEARWVID